MREFPKIFIVAVALLTGWFGYIYWTTPDIFSPQVHYAALMHVLEDYRIAKGSYPVFDAVDVPVEQLLERTGVDFRSGRLKGVDPEARYVSVTGQSYGLLYHFTQSGQPVTCIVEFRTSKTGWWGQPPPCPG